MLIQENKGRWDGTVSGQKKVDYLGVEWYETNKRILHKRTLAGTPVTLRFLNQNPDLKDGDLLFEDDHLLVLVEIIACKTIVLAPNNFIETAALCYEIGNRHLPLFIEGQDLLVPFEMPLFHLLQASGYQPEVQERKLEHALKTTVLPHVEISTDQDLTQKIVL